jgi:phenylalanyl-tRNA synthetase beta chain
LDLDDALFTLKLTPNRADCLSLKGVAREVAAITGSPCGQVEFALAPSQALVAPKPVIADQEACGLYLNRLLVLKNPQVATPLWMERRLVRSGIRTHSIVVDVTNYVLLEQGQPLHAFDQDKLAGALSVRWAKAGEKLKLLNEQSVELKDHHLVIADEKGPVALAGVMGALDSAVTEASTNILLESAFFAPAAIAGRAREFALSSDSAHRFERGVDYANSRLALERATQLLLDLCGGQAGEIITAQASLPIRTQVRVRPQRVLRVLGITLGTDSMVRLLSRLGCQVVEAGLDLLVTPPSWRFDLEIEADFIEEIARLHGYDNIPVGAPMARFAMSPNPEGRLDVASLKTRLVERGYQEVITYSFVDSQDEQRLSAQPSSLKLMNPIASNLSVMRSSILPGLVNTLVFNTSRKQERVRIFEAGRCFHPAEGRYLQPQRLAGLIYGSQLPEQWGSPSRDADFFDLKADVEALCQGKDIQFSATTHPAFHPGRCAAITCQGAVLGTLGEMHPALVREYDLARAPCLFELELEPLLASPIPHYQAVSRFQPVRRDLAVLVDKTTPVGQLLAALNQNLPTFVSEVSLFDLYAGTGLPENKKSLAFRIVMQDTEKTLNDAELEAAVAQVLSLLTDRFGAQLR